VLPARLRLGPPHRRYVPPSKLPFPPRAGWLAVTPIIWC